MSLFCLLLLYPSQKINGDYTCGEHGVTYRIAESLCYTPETSVMLYVNYTSIF